jgi:hypothetical protein
MFKIDPKNTAERFDLSKFMDSIDGSFFDSVNSDFLLKVTKVKNFGTYRVVSEAGRPDLLSERIYGTGLTQYWWILMYYNNLRNPSDIKTGMIIRYVSISDLEDIYFTLVPSLDQPESTTIVETLV